jgi:transcription elongation GreA/GreB family factor
MKGAGPGADADLPRIDPTPRRTKATHDTLTKDHDDITNGYPPAASPLGSQLPGASEDDEAEFNIGNRVRRAPVLRIDRPQ